MAIQASDKLDAIVPNIYSAKKLLIVIIALTLSACASGPRQSNSDRGPTGQPTLEAPLQVGISHQRSSREWLELAEQSEGNQRNEALLNAAAQFQRAGQWQHAAAVLAQSQTHIRNSELTQAHLHLRQYLLANQAAHEEEWRQVDQFLRPLLTPRVSTHFAEEALQLAIRSQLAQDRWDTASSYQLQRLDRGAIDANDVDAVWSMLQHVREPEALEIVEPTRLTRGWQQLLVTLHQAAANPAAGQALWQRWLAQFEQHPATALAEDLLEEANQRAPQKALVLLPLTGQFAEQGQAVRDGMIMALAKRPDLAVTIVDTQSLDFSSIPEILQTEQADVLIGPLLKENITRVDANALPQQLQWLTLNEPPGNLNVSIDRQRFYALDTETEVRQAAHHIHTLGHRSPLVLFPQSSRGETLSQVFSDTWTQLQDDGSLSFGTYQTPDDMKATVQSQLGVTQSEARIWQVKIAAGKIIVDSQPRSRADIDAIYLVGGIEQTRLLKPFIDVNIAPFMQPIPVYANSGSHTLRNDLSENDLDSVHFTDAPWLIPDHPQHQQLEQLIGLRKHWGHNLARLAAFGHDSVLLTQQGYWLAALPGLTVDGLTGALRLDDNRVLRQLQWARYDGHRVVADTQASD